MGTNTGQQGRTTGLDLTHRPALSKRTSGLGTNPLAGGLVTGSVDIVRQAGTPWEDALEQFLRVHA